MTRMTRTVHCAAMAILVCGAAQLGGQVSVKPGAMMPKIPLSDAERDSLVHYLAALK